jgi:hypothetical protein
MATRKLEVDLVVSDAQARAAFQRTGREVGILEKRFGTAGRNMSTVLGAASTRVNQLGQAARTATPYIAGGLALGLGKAVAEAREAEKVGRQTTQVIKTMGAESWTSAEGVAELSERISEKTAIDDEQIQSSANLMLSFKNVRDGLGQNNQIFSESVQLATDMSVRFDQDLKTSVIQLGKALNDPAFGASALSRIGALTHTQVDQIQKMAERGASQLELQQKLLTAVQEQAAGAAAANADSMDRLRVVGENFAESIGGKVLPELEELASEVADVLSDKNLTSEQRAERLGEILQERVIEGIDALAEIAPEAAKAGGKVALAVAKGFGEAFLESDTLGKVFLGAAFIRAVGGPGALGKLGGKLAAWIAAPMAATIAAETAAGTNVGAAAGSWKGAGKIAGRLFGAGMVLGLALVAPDLLKAAHDLGKAIGEELKGPMQDAEDALTPPSPTGWPDPLGNLDFLLNGSDNEERHEIGGGLLGPMPEILKKTGKGLDDVAKSAENADKAVGKFGRGGTRNLRDVERGSEKLEKNGGNALVQLGKQLGLVEREGGSMERSTTRAFDRVSDASAKSTGRVADNTANMVNAVGKLLGVLSRNTNEALKGYGAKPVTFGIETAAAAVQKKQAGGKIVPGYGTGDIVPDQLPVGGGVLNRNAVNAFFGLQGGGSVPVVLEPGEMKFNNWTPELEWMNQAVPRFQSGGLVQALGPYEIPPIEYDPNHAGGNSHLHLSFSSVGAAKGFASRIRPLGWSASESPWAGGVTVQHQDPGHYDGRAFDANSGDESRSAVAAVAKLLGAGGGGMPIEKIKRLLLKGPKGTLRNIGQGAGDAAWKAAAAHVRSHRPTSGVSTIEGDGNVERVFAKVARKLSTSKTATLALGMAGYAESGMRDLSYGDSSSQGALQLLASTAAGLGVSPHDEGAIASLFFNRGFYGRGGANSLAARGLPAHLVAQNVQGSAFASGSNYAAQKGPAQAWMRRFGLQGGGAVKGRGWQNVKGTMTPPPDREFLPPWAITQRPFAPIPNAPKFTYEEQLTQLDIALQVAEGTAGIDDDAAVLESRFGVLSDQRDKVQSQLANLSLSESERKKIQKQALEQTANLEKRLRKGGITPAERKRLDRERMEIEKQLGQGALGSKRADLLDQLNGLIGELGSTRESIDGLVESNEDTAALAEEMKALRESIEAQTRILASESYIQRQELLKGMADLISGEIGGNIARNEYVAGYGTVTSA